MHARTVYDQPGSDADIVALIRQRDQRAMVCLYDEYASLVYGVALRVTRRTAAAEDIVQDVFLQLWRNPGSFDPQRGRLAPWLAVIARNKAVDMLRKPQSKEELTETPLHALSSPEPSPERVADAERAKNLMRRLPDDQRHVLELAFLDGLTHVEIAAKTGEPLGTIKSRIRLGLTFLRKELAT